MNEPTVVLTVDDHEVALAVVAEDSDVSDAGEERTRRECARPVREVLAASVGAVEQLELLTHAAPSTYHSMTARAIVWARGGGSGFGSLRSPISQ